MLVLVGCISDLLIWHSLSQPERFMSKLLTRWIRIILNLVINKLSSKDPECFVYGVIIDVYLINDTKSVSSKNLMVTFEIIYHNTIIYHHRGTWGSNAKFQSQVTEIWIKLMVWWGRKYGQIYGWCGRICRCCALKTSFCLGSSSCHSKIRKTKQLKHKKVIKNRIKIMETKVHKS